MQPQEEPNPLMRKKKTPEELAAEAEQEELDDFTSKFKRFKQKKYSFAGFWCDLFSLHNNNNNRYIHI